MGDDHNDWLDATLQPLKTSPHVHDWPSTDDLQRRGQRHRQRQHRAAIVSGGTGMALAVVLVVGLLASSGGNHTPGPVTTALPGNVQAVSGPDGSVHLVADVKGTSHRSDTAGISAVSAA